MMISHTVRDREYVLYFRGHQIGWIFTGILHDIVLYVRCLKFHIHSHNSFLYVLSSFALTLVNTTNLHRMDYSSDSYKKQQQ